MLLKKSHVAKGFVFHLNYFLLVWALSAKSIKRL